LEVNVGREAYTCFYIVINKHLANYSKVGMWPLPVVVVGATVVVVGAAVVVVGTAVVVVGAAVVVVGATIHVNALPNIM
jgi:hypothetical protein